MKKLLLLFVLLTGATWIATAQQGNIWYFGTEAGLDFNGGPPVPLTNSAMTTFEGCASIADQNGQLLFYTNGITVWNKNHVAMANGTGLQGSNSSTQSAIIVPKPGSPDHYFVFTVPDLGQTSVGLRYSEVDMSMNGGLGQVMAATKNTLLTQPVVEKVTSVKHANGIDYWVITHSWNSNEFKAFLVTSAGINATPVTTAIGTNHNISAIMAVGYMKASPDGSKIALAISNTLHQVDVFDFNPANGTLSNFNTLSNAGFGVYGVEFSPNSNLLYTANWLGGLSQYDLTAGNWTAVENSIVTLASAQSAGALQLGPDGKIYMTRNGQSVLGVIDQPDVIGTGCNYGSNTQSLGGKTGQFGLPTFIQSFFSPSITLSYNDTCYGDLVQFSYTSPNVADSVEWWFGEPSSGALDTSNLTNPTHLYADTGSYPITLIGYFSDANNNVFIDTTFDTLQVLPLPFVDLGPDTFLCTGDTLPLNALGTDLDYLWSDNSTLPSLSITQSGTYWVEVSNLCGSYADTVEIDSIYFIGVDLPNDTLLCVGDSLLLNAEVPFGSYLWSDPSNFAPTYIVTGPGTYWAEATNVCGTESDTIEVEYEVPPITILPNDTSMCIGATIEPNVSFSRGTYLWSDGSTDSTLVISQPGIYWVEVTNPCGVDSDTMQVFYDYPLNINLGSDTVVCVGEAYLLNPPTAGASHLWQDNSTGLTNVVSQAGTYWLEATNLCGVYTDTVEVEYEVPPTVELGEDLLLCDGDTVSYDVTFSRASYNWSFASVQPEVDLTTENQYSVTVTNLCGSAVDSVYLSYDFPVNPDLGPNQQLCQGDMVLIDGTQPHRADYIWNTGDTVPIITATSTGFYWLKMTNACGTFGDSVTLLFRAPPEINFSPSYPDTLFICGEEGIRNSVELASLESALGHRWQDGSSYPTYTVTSEGLYWLEASNECGKSRDSAYVRYVDNPVVDLGVDTFFCKQAGLLQWDVSYAVGSSYLWIDGSTDAQFVPEEAGVYWAEVTDRYGCVGTDDIVVDECPVSVWLPNSFTPNNDQKNDIFKAEGSFLIEFDLRVFNRFGQQIFRSVNLDRGWDGTVDGVMSPVGVYSYKLYYRGENTDEMTETGTFHLIR